MFLVNEVNVRFVLIVVVGEKLNISVSSGVISDLLLMFVRLINRLISKLEIV